MTKASNTPTYNIWSLLGSPCFLTLQAVSQHTKIPQNASGAPKGYRPGSIWLICTAEIHQGLSGLFMTHNMYICIWIYKKKFMFSTILFYFASSPKENILEQQSQKCLIHSFNGSLGPKQSVCVLVWVTTYVFLILLYGKNDGKACF